MENNVTPNASQSKRENGFLKTIRMVAGNDLEMISQTLSLFYVGRFGGHLAEWPFSECGVEQPYGVGRLVPSITTIKREISLPALKCLNRVGDRVAGPVAGPVTCRIAWMAHNQSLANFAVSPFCLKTGCQSPPMRTVQMLLIEGVLLTKAWSEFQTLKKCFQCKQCV